MRRWILGLFALVMVFGLAPPVHAAIVVDNAVYLGEKKMQKDGYTVTSSGGDFRVGIRPGIFEDPAWVKIKLADTASSPIPENFRLASDELYEYDIRVPNPTVTKENIWLSMDFTPSGNYRVRPYTWDRSRSVWWEIPSRRVRGQDTLQFELPFPWSIVAVFEDTTRTEGPQKLTSQAPPATGFQAYAIMDGRTGKILESANGDTQKYPASLTKLMTAMVMLDQHLDMNDVLTYEASDNAEGARLRISPGETLTRNDAYMTTMLGSGNNTANMLARTSGMSREAFIQAMNDKARSLGLTQTHFVDPSGLSTGNVTTPNEYAKVINEAGKYFDIWKTFQMRSYSFSTINLGIPHTILSTNKLVVPQRTLVSKTGYLWESAYNLGTMTADENGNELVVVTFGHASASGRFTDTANLITWAWNSYSWN